MKKIMLVGYMGSGKSIIAKLIAEKLDWNKFELDEIIEKKAEKTISEIFEIKGELYFRKLEKQLLDELLLNPNHSVISTGGGTPCYFDNYKVLEREDVISIYLQASIDTIAQRLENESNKRPLLKDLNNLEKKEFIAKHLFERSYYYLKSKYKIDVNNKTPDEITSEILALLT
jgi:shikimate kinase